MSQYESLKKSSGLSAYVEELYEIWLDNPDDVSLDWRRYFEREYGARPDDQSRLNVQEKFAILASIPKSKLGESRTVSDKQVAVNALIRAYRTLGHLVAKVDPLDLREKRDVPELSLAFHGLSETDLNTSFTVDTSLSSQPMTLNALLVKLQAIYTDTIGIEYPQHTDEAQWLQTRLEQNTFVPTPAQKKQILDNLIKADGLEKYLAMRYVGQKRFSLEGGDALISLMYDLLHYLGEHGVKETVIGMAHRGRLNMLLNIMGKSASALFDEFEGRAIRHDMPGDVKYHLGFSSDMKTKGGDMHLHLAFNPSHLESVNPVIQGSARARLERRAMQENIDNLMDIANTCVPIQIHGDAAFAGQGVNMETLQLSQVRGYRVGGTLHIIVNNQVGFTTSHPQDARSSLYASDPIKMLDAPVFHVNGDDPEAVALVTQIAADYLLTFQKDVMIDLVCYRRLGHNEADDPSMTQPRMYELIRQHKTPAAIYADKLIGENLVNREEVTKMKDAYRQQLDAGDVVASAVQTRTSPWGNFAQANWDEMVDTRVSITEIESLSARIFTPPEGFSTHRLVGKTLQSRLDMGKGDKPMDWGFAENLAYASLLNDGYQVRLSGEDVGRGTFTHRQAVLHDTKTGEAYLTLANVRENQPTVRVTDSILSEEAALAFEYGFSASEANALVVWEAQFGDFANCAQVAFDQYISAGGAKWGRYCGLVVLLPHGQEGMGPEHSSARLERYLQLCADNNMRVCVPSTPAQCFHMLRRQVKQTFRKPLIVMTPKSLLRHKLAVNERADLTDSGFQTVLDEIDDLDKDKIERLVFCAGKVYYDLLTARRELGLSNVAILRIEELYPFPEAEYHAHIAQYPNIKHLVWCQEEPQNQGAWRNIVHHLHTHIKVEYAGRPESASTAAGYASVFKTEQTTLINQALKGDS